MKYLAAYEIYLKDMGLTSEQMPYAKFERWYAESNRSKLIKMGLPIIAAFMAGNVLGGRNK